MKILIAFFLFIGSLTITAQTYRIATTKDAVAKIDMSALPNLNAGGWHLIYQNAEVPIYISDDNIYFLGRMQHGDDTYFDEYSYEAVYYLRYDESAPAKRYNPLSNNNNTITADYIYQSIHLEQDLIYSLGYNVYDFNRSKFEGYYWKTLRDYPGNAENPLFIQNAQLLDTCIFQSNSNAILRVCFSTIMDSNSANKYKINRKLCTILNGDTIGVAEFDTLADRHIATYSVPYSSLSAGINVIEFLNLTADSIESRITIDYYEIEGICKPNLIKGSVTFDTMLAENADWKIGNSVNPIVIIDTLSNSITFNNEQIISIGVGQHSITATDVQFIENASVTLCNESNLRSLSNKAKMTIIYHNTFKTQALEYAEYRKSRGVSIFTADIDDVYKEFSFGRKSPQAIKDFLRYAYENWQDTTEYALLIGDASDDPRRCLFNSKSIDYVSTYGNPASDYWLGCFNTIPDHCAEIKIGRIPCSTPQELENYIAKVKQYEQAPAAAWQKNLLFVNGGYYEFEKSQIRISSEIYATYFYNPPLCADTLSISKDWDDMTAVSDKKKNELIAAVNKGVMFAIFNGHGSPASFDMTGWQVDYINNTDKYGILMSMSCNTGAFSEIAGATINEDYILKYPNKGFVAALGATTSVTIGSNSTFMNGFVSNLTSIDKPSRRLGDLIEAAKRAMNYSTGNQYINVMRYNFSLLGDPTIEVKIASKPDIYISDVQIKNTNGDLILEQNDTAIITIELSNAGTSFNGKFKNKVEHFYNGELNDYFVELDSLYRSKIISLTIPLESKVGLHSITITADSDNDINEHDKSNNTINIEFMVVGDTNYIPILAINPVNSGFQLNKVLRGDTAVLLIEVDNLSNTDVSPIAELIIQHIEFETINIPQLEPNEKYIFEYKIITDNLSYYNNYSAWIDIDITHKYMYSLEIVEDTTNPSLQIFADDSELHDKDYISSEPIFNIVLMDNSLLPITLANPISIRFNGIPLNADNTQAFNLITFPRGSNTKAMLTVQLEKLTDRENYLQVTGRDATGNTISQNYYLYVALNNDISTFAAFPIPAVDDITFNYYLQTSIEQNEAKVEIVNSIGMRVRTLYAPAKVRDNYILWDLKDDYGKPVAAGTYHTRLNIVSELWSEPRYIKVIIAK